MEKVIEALGLITTEDEDEIIKALKVSSLVLDVYPEQEVAIMGILYPYRVGKEMVKAFGEKVEEGVRQLKTIREGEEGYFERLQELPYEMLLIITCEWLYRVEKAAIRMYMEKRYWERGVKVHEVLLSVFKDTNIEMYVNQIGIHLRVLEQMGWVKF